MVVQTPLLVSYVPYVCALQLVAAFSDDCDKFSFARGSSICFLQPTRNDAANMILHDIVELVYETVKRVEDNNSKRKINISINQDMPLCRLDKGMLEQIIYNLLNNAVIHTTPDCSIGISATVHGDLLEIIIQDSGKGFIGIDSKDVFDKFSRSKNPKTSRPGLGLSIVKGFTEALGGNVELQKSKPSGSRFTISIPVKTTYSLILQNE